jgi:hypothetical protein
MPCPASPESPHRASPFGATAEVRRTGMWFTWSSGAGGPFGLTSSSLRGAPGPAAEATIRHSRGRACAPAHGPRHAAASAGATCGGKISDRSRGSLAVHCCPPRPSSTSPRSGPRGPSTGPLAETSVSTCATLLTLAPTFPTRSGPCDPAATPGFLSWGCPKIAPPSYEAEKSDLPEDRGGVAAAPDSLRLRRALAASNRGPHRCGTGALASASFGMGKPIPIRRAALVVSHHLGGFLLLDPATIFRPLPIVGFTAFPPVAKQDSPLCTFCPSKLSLRRQLRSPGRIPALRGPASPWPIVADRHVHR